ncbi:HAD domain-containing protein [Herbaspirillum rhizosphaerae]|uniref:HAD domain-containing protein n=1 Tax=Herbaspirillum rhizosphaerae TaxID=346179 RepID=UPI00067D7DBF|nr:HAD domain-containing protein [Herbaspirillum rhizosphaerae]
MILFLDFDGVLHPVSREAGTFAHLIHFECVIRDFPGVDIVISSAWRENHSLEELQAFFTSDLRQRIIDVTPVLSHLSHQYLRQAEIMLWLREAGREYEGWIAIDDSDWLFAPACRNLILVDTDIGFDSIAEKNLRAKLSGY